MSEEQLNVRRAAVLGAGVMGAQIAAHLVNAGIETLLFELPADQGDPNQLVDRAIKHLVKLKPPPLAGKDIGRLVVPANYDQHLEQLTGCDLIIEAIAERMDWKQALYEKVAPHIAAHTIFATNTSGLSINALASVLPEQLRDRFCGVHFFNPPRYMHLVELIPHDGTAGAVMDQLESFLTTAVGKGVVRAKDTPNFIGNRVGVFSMLSTMHHTGAFGLGFDTVDALTGPAIGRPKSATYRTADVVGLDTMAHVIRTMTDQLPDDPWHRYYAVPDWLQQLIENGALGQKAGLGVYRKQGKLIEVLDTASGDYRPLDTTLPEDLQAALGTKDPAEKLAAFRASDHPEGQFLWALFRDLFHYCAVHLAEIADSAREVDQAIRWGYGWKQGPFEIWQAAGWRQIADWIAEDIAAGKSMSATPLPDWVFDGREGVHGADGSWSAAGTTNTGRSNLAVYRRQLQPERLLGEARDAGITVKDLDGLRLWTLDDAVLIASFNTKMHTINQAVIDGLQQAVDLAESEYSGLVIWQTREPFCVGADLAAAAGLVQAGDMAGLEQMIGGFQQAVQRLKYSLVPTVAAVRGMALGGGCEILLHCARTVAAMESYIGLVEAGVGLLPGGGGLKELAIRSVDNTAAGDSFALLQTYYQTVAMGKVAGSAREARQFGFLTAADPIVMHPHEVLHVAIEQAKAMSASGYRPPLRNRRWPAGGDVGIATLKMLLVNMAEGHFISEHDMEIGSRIATVICGGEIDRGTPVPEDWFLALEREHFAALAVQEKTQQRIAHMLKTGKPLRN